MTGRPASWISAALLAGAAACGDGGTGPVENPLAITQVSVGAEHACALSSQGGVYCWGRGAEGQVGQGALAAAGVPTRVVGATPFTSVSAGARHTCGLDGEGSAWCWGWNAYYQRGNPTDTATARPVRVVGGLRFTALDAGGNHTCALTAEGEPWCWGYNRFGQLGDGTTNTSIGPVRVAGGLRFRQISAGMAHTCGVTTTGSQTWCWGSNALGQLGVGSDTLFTAAPRRVAGGVVLTQVSAGMDHTCGVNSAGVLYCWGGNARGQLANGGSAPEGVPGALTPTASKAPQRFRLVSAGAEVACGILQTTGQAFCWGRGESGQLGNGDTRDHYVPQPVFLQPEYLHGRDLLRFGNVAAGARLVCGASNEAALFCWGWGVPRGEGAAYMLFPTRIAVAG